MTSLELVQKLAQKGADLNARMARKVNVGLTSLNTKGATPFFLSNVTATSPEWSSIGNRIARVIAISSRVRPMERLGEL